MSFVSLFSAWFAPYVRARFGRTQRGASFVEYALLLMFIVLVCLAALTVFGSSASDEINRNGSSVADA